MALTTARVVTGRERIMAFKGGYHGGVLLYKTGASPQNAPFPLVLGTYNDADRTVDAIDRHAHELAAVILEPMQGSAGCIPADRDFLQAVRDACTRHGIVLIFDEVMTSRLGPSGLQEMMGVRSDLTTLGKYVGGGLPFGAFGGRADLMDRYDPRRADCLAHAGTFNNNALTMAAGFAGMGEVYTPERAETLTRMGDNFRARLNACARKRQLAVQVTGIGSMMSVHFHSAPLRSVEVAEMTDPRIRALFHLEMLGRGQYVARRGMVNLSLPMTEADLDGFLSAFEDFLDEYAHLLAMSDRGSAGESKSENAARSSGKSHETTMHRSPIGRRWNSSGER